MTVRSRLKLEVARVLHTTGLSWVCHELQLRMLAPFIRAVNYHDVPASLRTAFSEQLRFYRRHFIPVGPNELSELMACRWRWSRPGILLSFDDGLRSHAEVVAPLLEEYGFSGWFFVPPAFVDMPEEKQADFAGTNHILVHGTRGFSERLAMSWEDVRRLDRRHMVGCHTLTHRRLAESTPRDVLEREVVIAKQRLESELGHRVAAFAWVGGEEWSYSRAAARAVRRAGFELGFMTNNAVIRPGTDPFALQRTNVEASDPPALVRFQLSGLLDIVYLPKRRRLRRLAWRASSPAARRSAATSMHRSRVSEP